MFYDRKLISAYNIDYLWKETNKVSAKIKNKGSENLINIDFILIYNQPISLALVWYVNIRWYGILLTWICTLRWSKIVNIN